MPNAYLDRLKGQHEEIRSRIAGLQETAVREDRDLSPDELRSVQEDGQKAAGLAEQIEALHEQETRSAKVAALAPIPAPTNGEGDQNRGRATTQDRDPGHYRSAVEGGRESFFRDMFRSRSMGDESATRRLTEHTRALSVGSGTGNTLAGGGIVPPKWLTDLYLPLARQGRVLADQVTPLALGDDPRPIVLPRQTAGTDAVVGQQTEGQAVNGTDAFNTGVETLTPTATAGKQTVTRQLVDSATPAVDQLIYGDLLSVLNAQIESKVATAMVTAAGTAIHTFTTSDGSVAADTDFRHVSTATGVAASNALIDAEVAVHNGRFMAANVIAMSATRWGSARKITDLQGRPVLTAYQAAGARGQTDGATLNGPSGEWEGLPVYVTTALGITAPDTILVAFAKDVLLAESDMLQFRFEEVAGPADIVLGIWKYVGVLARYGGVGVKAIAISA